jgi:hypothetical protein
MESIRRNAMTEVLTVWVLGAIAFFAVIGVLYLRNHH